MHDSIQMEKRGIPSVAICTEPFVSSAQYMSRMGGISDYRYAVIPHPIGSLRKELLAERAKQALPQVEALILAKA